MDLDFLKDLALTIVAALAVPIAGILAAYVLQLLRKIGLELDAENAAKLRAGILDLIRSVNEWARRIEKTGPKPTSAQKLDRAIALAAQQPLLAGLDRIELSHAVDALLPLARIEEEQAPCPPRAA